MFGRGRLARLANMPSAHDATWLDVRHASAGVAVLVGVIWLQTLFWYHYQHRRAHGSPHAHVAVTAGPYRDPLGTDLMVRIADVELALTRAFAALASAGPAAALLPPDDVAMAGRIATRGPAALRDLRGQFVALGRAATTALSPDRERLASARQLIRLRLVRGLRDCEELAAVAGTPYVDDFPRVFTAATERVSILVADVNP
jgi:hypothetical protein